MLKELLLNDFGKDLDLNCAEKMLYGANEAYKLNMTKEDLKVAAGFGGGMGIESTCGALTGAIMAIGRKYTETVAHADESIKEKVVDFLEEYKEKMGTINCDELKEKYKTEEKGCSEIIIKAAEMLDRIMKK